MSSSESKQSQKERQKSSMDRSMSPSLPVPSTSSASSSQFSSTVSEISSAKKSFPLDDPIKNRAFIKDSLNSCLDKINNFGLHVPEEYHHFIVSILDEYDFDIEKTVNRIQKDMIPWQDLLLNAGKVPHMDEIMGKI